MGIAGIITAALICCLILWVSLTYNLMVSRHNKMDMIWDEVEQNLKIRRAHLKTLIEAGGRRIEEPSQRINDVIARMPEGLSGPAIAPFEREISVEIARIRAVAAGDPSILLDPDFVTALGEIASAEGRAKSACSRYSGLVDEFAAAAGRWPASLVVKTAKMEAKEAEIFD